MERGDCEGMIPEESKTCQVTLVVITNILRTYASHPYFVVLSNPLVVSKGHVT